MWAGLVRGAVAGAAATIPMSLTMAAVHSVLPRRQQYSYPPTEISRRAAEAVGVPARKESAAHRALTLGLHFAYGAAMGGLYNVLRDKPQQHRLLKGTAWGLAVWSGSYLGLMPAVRLYPAAVHWPHGRNAMMISAHIVWGAALAALLPGAGRTRRARPAEPGREKDAAPACRVELPRPPAL